MISHSDWYADELDDDNEALWRLDFAIDNDAIQIQLFMTLGPDEKWVAARIFAERDNRHRVRNDVRIDYACTTAEILPADAEKLLMTSAPVAIGILAKVINRLRGLSCDRKFVLEDADRKDVVPNSEARTMVMYHFADSYTRINEEKRAAFAKENP